MIEEPKGARGPATASQAYMSQRTHLRSPMPAAVGEDDDFADAEQGVYKNILPKVVELQAMSTPSTMLSKIRNKLRLPGEYREKDGTLGTTNRLFTPRLRGLILLNLVRAPCNF